MSSPFCPSLKCSICFDDSSELLTPTKEEGKRVKTVTLTAGHGWMDSYLSSKMHCCSMSSIPPPPVITLPSVWVDLVLGHHWCCLMLTKHVGHSPDIAGNVSLCDKPAVPICLGGFTALQSDEKSAGLSNEVSPCTLRWSALRGNDVGVRAWARTSNSS